eukprot:6400668-Pyramimonas_sp.AAC.1
MHDYYAAEFMNHAIHDAGLLLHWARIERDAPGLFPTSRCFYDNLKDDECCSEFSSEIPTPEEIITHWPAVEAADRKEVNSFVSRGIFKLAPSSVSNNTINGTWVRSWADRSKGQVKNRRCGGGFLDRQKCCIERHSSTASRLSHRLAASLAAQCDLVNESLDISTAFLQGLKFSEFVRWAAAPGREVRRIRKVWLKPPPNLRRHLRNVEGSGIDVQDQDIVYFVIERLKAAHGF